MTVSDFPSKNMINILCSRDFAPGCLIGCGGDNTPPHSPYPWIFASPCQLVQHVAFQCLVEHWLIMTVILMWCHWWPDDGESDSVVMWCLQWRDSGCDVVWCHWWRDDCESDCVVMWCLQWRATVSFLCTWKCGLVFIKLTLIPALSAWHTTCRACACAASCLCVVTT